MKARKRQEKEGLKPNTATDRPKKTAGQKLSYKHKFRLEQLPDEIAALETKIKTQEAALADPEFFNRDADGFMKATKTRTSLKETLEAAEMEWLELEDLKETAQGA